MLTLIARAAGAVPLLPEDAGFKTLEPVVNSCACCEGSLAAMLDYCRTQKPMGDLHMEHFSCDNIHSPGCGASEAKCDCEARMAQLRQDNCTLKCKVLESVPFACPSCVVPSPPPPPPPSPVALVSECRPVATPCCEAMLGQLQKFCFSFKPAGGWPRATKCDDPSHWDGGQMVPPAAFDPLLDDWCPAACGKAQCAQTAGRWLALFSRKHPDICAAILDENCDGFCAKQCPNRFMPAEPTPAAIATPLPSPAARLLGKMAATTMQEAEDAARRAPS